MLIKVKVKPGCSKQSIVKQSENSFEVQVKEKPIMGQANRATIALLSSYLKINSSKIRLIRGLKTRNKIFEIIEKNDLQR